MGRNGMEIRGVQMVTFSGRRLPVVIAKPNSTLFLQDLMHVLWDLGRLVPCELIEVEREQFYI